MLLRTLLALGAAPVALLSAPVLAEAPAAPADPQTTSVGTGQTDKDAITVTARRRIENGR